MEWDGRHALDVMSNFIPIRTGTHLGNIIANLWSGLHIEHLMINSNTKRNTVQNSIHNSYTFYHTGVLKAMIMTETHVRDLWISMQHL